MNKTMMVLLAATGLVLAVGGGFYLGKSSDPAEATAVAERDSAKTQAEVTRDVPGLPALYIEGREYEKNDITLSEYFAEFNTEAVIDPETKKMRPESAAKIKQELIGKQMTWDGYVRRVETAPSGRLVLVLQQDLGASTLKTAMVKFSPIWKNELLGYEKGEHVRVVGLFDRVFTVFPSLNGMSVEIIPPNATQVDESEG
jgi:hypothetical protein